jgi:hypothetical protein
MVLHEVFISEEKNGAEVDRHAFEASSAVGWQLSLQVRCLYLSNVQIWHFLITEEWQKL